MSNLPKAKHLTFNEMWQLYKLLGNTSKEHLLIDEIQFILKKITKQDFIKVLQLLYGNNIVKILSPINSISLLIDGLAVNNFYAFSTLVNEFTK